MPEGKQSSDGKAPSVKWVGFYNWRPSETEKEVIRENIVEPSRVEHVMCDFIERGYKVSLSWDSYGDCPMVSVTGGATGNGNAGYTITQRHSDLLVALSAVYWFCAERCNWEDWPETDPKQGQWDW